MIPDTPDSSETRLAMLNTEAVVSQLLDLCLARIGWQGELAEWQTRLTEALDGVQARLLSETDPFPLRITGHQMDCLIHLCRAASLGHEPEIRTQLLLFSQAFPRQTDFPAAGSSVGN